MAGARPPLRFSTRGVPPAARGRALRTSRGRGLLPVEPLPDAVPTAELVKWRLPGASLLSGRFCGVRQIETEADRAGAVRLVPARTPALQLLARYLRSVLDGPVPTGELADAVVGHVTELIALSLGAPAGSPTAAVGVRAARLQSIKTDIARNLSDPGLSAGSDAARHGISTRYLHRLFEDDGRTFRRRYTATPTDVRRAVQTGGTATTEPGGRP